MGIHVLGSKMLTIAPIKLIIKSKALKSYSSGLLLNHIPPILYL